MITDRAIWQQFIWGASIQTLADRHWPRDREGEPTRQWVRVGYERFGYARLTAWIEARLRRRGRRGR